MAQRTKILSLGVLSLLIVLGGSLAVAWYLQQEMPDIEAERTLTSNLGFFILINLNIIVVMILGFLVIKNLVKLVLDRRRNILGAKLRSRLITAFVGLSLIPTVLLFLVAKGMLERGLQEWFSPQIAASVDGALGVARYHYDSAESQIYRFTRHVTHTLEELAPHLFSTAAAAQSPDDPQAKALLERMLEEKREQFGLFDLAILNQNGAVLARASSLEARRAVAHLPGPNLAHVRRALTGEAGVTPEQSIDGEFLRGYAPLRYSPIESLSGGVGYRREGNLYSTQEPGQVVRTSPRYVVMATHWVLPELAKSLGAVVNAYDDYRELKSYRRPIASSYILTLVVVTLLIVFGAVWVGFYLAKDLSVPIGLLAEGTQQVAHGNLDYQIPEVGDDELSVLVRSFNTMTDDLKATTGELENRRRYMETILASVGVGVLSIDPDGRLTTLNRAAGRILNLSTKNGLLPRAYAEVLPEELSAKIAELLEGLYAGAERLMTTNLSLEKGKDSKHLHLSATKLVDERGGQLGAVVLLDDITELVSAQRMAAWREVARRIAHEIKNPLTPIQLCAERMQRKFAADNNQPIAFGPNERQVIRESTEIIVNQVENLRALVNEFSRFARMPKSNPRPADLNQVIRETVLIYREAHPEYTFLLSLDENLPSFALDREQIARALINLVDNSVASLRSAITQREAAKPKNPAQKALGLVGTLLGSAGGAETAAQEPTIEVSTSYNAELGLVSLVVTDTGVGISEKDKPRLFEPYYSTKGGGTGLGLTIVSAIISDHNGFIRVRDNTPSGASFVIELPVETAATDLKALG